MTTPTDPAAPPAPAAPIQFDRAEYSTSAGAAQPCAACKRLPVGVYYTANKQIVCAPCREAFAASQAAGSRVGRFSKALVYGLGAALAGALLWFAVWKVTGLYIGLVAIVVGAMVGKAVHAGSGQRGGLGYQLLAVVLTYLCVVIQYLPIVYEAMSDQPEAASANRTALVIAASVTAVVAPVLSGARSIFGLLIIAFALWEAWKINRKRSVQFTGPYAIAAAPATVPPAGA